MQILAIGSTAMVVFVSTRWWSGNLVVDGGSMLAMCLYGFIVLWHSTKIFPYTLFASTQAKSTTRSRDDGSVRIVVSNVEMENDAYQQWMDVISAVDPDILISLEINKTWLVNITRLTDRYDNCVKCPQDNWYGMMMLSKFPIVESSIRYLVQDDIPSIDAIIELPGGEQVRVVAVHPRPPEPVRDNDSTSRDAELILHAKELEHESRPVIIGGDLNDVAWSYTTRLFLEISKLLDPRRGRGFFNTFHADHAWMRFPLDHLFHSTEFTVRDIRRLDAVGSDHFPIMLDLQFEPEREHHHEPLAASRDDRRQAEELVARTVEPA